MFLVTPNTDAKVIDFAVARNIPIVAGAFTPTEVHAAWAAGADMIECNFSCPQMAVEGSGHKAGQDPEVVRPLVRKHFATVIPPGDNKLAALNSAVWSGGSFVYVPPGVRVDGVEELAVPGLQEQRHLVIMSLNP
mgnify:CR=1 FL=1